MADYCIRHGIPERAWATYEVGLLSAATVPDSDLLFERAIKLASSMCAAFNTQRG